MIGGKNLIPIQYNTTYLEICPQPRNNLLKNTLPVNKAKK